MPEKEHKTLVFLQLDKSIEIGSIIQKCLLVIYEKARVEIG